MKHGLFLSAFTSEPRKVHNPPLPTRVRSPLKKFIPGLPIKLATNLLAGRSYSSIGDAIC